MERGVRHALVDLLGQLLDVTLTLRQHVDQLGSPTVGQGLGHIPERVEQGGDSHTVAPVLGLRQNAAQFALLVGANGLVGGMLGQERTVLPLLATEVFGLTAFTATLTFIAAFGMVKAATNFMAGALSDRYGRRPVLIAGWLIGIPVPLLLIWAPSWNWVIVANVLLGINQGLAWSTTVIMKIDLVGPGRRGFAMGLNEAAGYGAVAVTALVTGYLAQQWGLRPAPFLLGLAYAGLGLGASVLFVRETRGHADGEAIEHAACRTELGPAPPWCIPPCWRPWAMWHILRGVRARWACTDCGATPVSPSALSGAIVAVRMYETNPRDSSRNR